MASAAENKRKLQNQLSSDSAENSMRIHTNRWMATQKNRWMPQTQSDLVMADFNRAATSITALNVEQIVAAFPAWKLIETAGKPIMGAGVVAGIKPGVDLSFSMVGFVPSPADPLKRKAAALVDNLASKLIVEITDETRAAVNAILKDGIEKGKGLKQIGRELRRVDANGKVATKIGLNSRQMMASANFEEKLLINRPDLSPRQVRARVEAFDRKKLRERTATISRTEGQRVLSEAQIIGFEEAQVKILIWFALVGHDEECAEFQGQEFPIQATHGLQPLHPN